MEAHLSVNLWLKSVGVQNPFGDDSDGSERSSRASSQRNSPTISNNSRGGANGGGASHPSAPLTDANDVMVPPEEAEVRQLSVYQGSTGLALTLAGPCALEAPSAFQKCGIFWGTIFFVAIAFATERVLHMLCICARKTGSNSYGTVARSSCGGLRAHWQTSALEIGVLLLLLTHFITLLRRVGELWLQSMGSPTFSIDLLLLMLLIAMTPLLAPQKYHTMGHVWTIGLFSMLVFLSTLAALAILHYYQEDNESDQEKRFTQDNLEFENGNSSQYNNIQDNRRTGWDVIEGFQSFLVAFFATFNILPIQASLENPTRERMATVIHRGVTMGALLTYLVGIGGYFCVQAFSGDADFWESIHFYSGESNYTNRVLLYRISHSCCGLTIFLSTPLVLIPCRHSILELIETIYGDRQCPQVSDCQEDCETCTTRSSTQPGSINNSSSSSNSNSHNAYVVVHEETSLLPSIEEHPTYDLESSKLAQVLCTLALLTFAYISAVWLTLMDALFTWVGPILVYVFAFIIPALYFLGIQRSRRANPEKRLRTFARIATFSSFAGIAFSIVNIVHNLPRELAK